MQPRGARTPTTKRHSSKIEILITKGNKQKRQGLLMSDPALK
jgi:hypothetical protein